MIFKEEIPFALKQSPMTWNGFGIEGESLTISFSFFSALPSYYLNLNSTDSNINILLSTIDQNNVEALSPALQQAFFKVSLVWESVANITFINSGKLGTEPDYTLFWVASGSRTKPKRRLQDRFDLERRGVQGKRGLMSEYRNSVVLV